MGASIAGKLTVAMAPIGWYSFFRDYREAETTVYNTNRSLPDVWAPLPIAETMIKTGALKEGDYFVNTNFIHEGGLPRLMEVYRGKAVYTAHTWERNRGFVRYLGDVL